MIQVSELLNLAFDTVGLAILMALYREHVIPRHTSLFLGFFAVWLSNICTVAEGFLLYDFFNFCEHLFYAGSGLLFFIGLLIHFARPGEAES